MIRYFIIVVSLFIFCLLIGCATDLETQMRQRDKARVELEIASTKLDRAKVKTEGEIIATKLENELKANNIKFESEVKSIAHKAGIAAAQSDADLYNLAKQRGVKLSNRNFNITKANYKAADALIGQLKKDIFSFLQIHPFSKSKHRSISSISRDAPILVANFVDLYNPSESSMFGKVVSQQIASRFNQKSHSTIETKLNSQLFMKEGSGEFFLSQNIIQMSNQLSAQAVLVGTYTVARSKIYITMRVINVSDNQVLASHDYNVPITRDVFKMLF